MEKIILPTEEPITAPKLPTLQKLGTISQLALEKYQIIAYGNDQFKCMGRIK